MFTFCTRWHTRSLRRGKLPPKTPEWPKSALEVTSMRPKWPQSPLKVAPGAPKTNPSALKWSPKASPDPLKSIKKGVQDHPGTPLRKRTTPNCENPIIYYVFEVPLCENPIIYYVLSTPKTLIFLKSNENLIIYYVLEPPDKPVSAREREARWKEESFPNTFLLQPTSLYSLCFAEFQSEAAYSFLFHSILLYSVLLYMALSLLYSTLLYSVVPYPTPP